MPIGGLEALHAVLDQIPHRVVACSGGVDSLVLATVAHRRDPAATLVAHAVTPAVPASATDRVTARARTEGWSLELVTTGEFGDERYLANPTDRCYFCKEHLYSALEGLATSAGVRRRGWTVLSGANLDDLGEYRPGLVAAAEHGVRHALIEAGIDKAGVRRIARRLQLDFAELPASPCLASRLYTGTRVTPTRLRAVDAAEQLVRRRTGATVVRCRIRQAVCLVEVEDAYRRLIDRDLIEELLRVMRAIEPTVTAVQLDPAAYRPGRAIAVN